MKKGYFLCLLLVIFRPALSQVVHVHISNSDIYEFLDELSGRHIVDINTALKPYSRLFIAEKLAEAAGKGSLLTARQKKELEFYLRDYNKEKLPGRDFNKRFDLLYYKDSLFTFSLNPVGALQYWINENGFTWHRRNGADAFAYIGSRWGFYASLRDNHEVEMLAAPGYLTQRTGGAYKAEYDYSELRGGISYSWKWGSIGLVKDHLAWGSNENGSNILSGRSPSFAMLKLQIKPADWFEFNYFHGWLVSEVVDSSRTWYYPNIDRVNKRTVFREKYMAANFFTVRPVERLYLSFGNSIIYSDLGIEPAYLLPFSFFKSIDHTLNKGIDNQNSQMFFDISSRQIKHLHLHTSLFVDEVSIARMFDKERHSNFFSWKAGGELSGWPVRNLQAALEYTRTNPLVYQHYLPTLTFESNRFNLGHYLTDNADELFMSLGHKPLRGLLLSLSYTHARKGPDYDSLTTQRLGLPFMESVVWESSTLSFKARYQLLNDGFLFAEVIRCNTTGDVTRYTPALIRGRTTTLSFGANFGF